jgi:hypothetical protein
MSITNKGYYKKRESPHEIGDENNRVGYIETHQEN